MERDQLGDPGVDGIRLDLREVGCGGKDWIGLAQDRGGWRTLVNAVVNLRVPENAGNFVTGWEPVSFSRRTLLRGASKEYATNAFIRRIFEVWGINGLRISYLQRQSGEFPSRYSCQATGFEVFLVSLGRLRNLCWHHSFLGAFAKYAKTDYWLRHVCSSVCPHGTTRLPLDGFSLNLIFEYFSKMCQEISSIIAIEQE